MLHLHQQQIQQVYHVIKLFLHQIHLQQIVIILFEIIVIPHDLQLIKEKDLYQTNIIHQNVFVH